MIICLIDTSVFVEILNVPGKSQHYQEVMRLLKNKVENQEKLFLPMATIFETGNHIAQNGDGRLRRACAERFVTQIKLAIEGCSPFTPLNFVTKENIQIWLEKFPDFVSQEMGLGDLSIIQDFEIICEQNPKGYVYIWSYDEHLSQYSYGKQS